METEAPPTGIAKKNNTKKYAEDMGRREKIKHPNQDNKEIRKKRHRAKTRHGEKMHNMGR